MFAFFADLKDSFYRLSGIRQSTIPRDIAYDFMQLGIMLERTEDVSRMLDVKYHFLLPRLEDVGGSLDILQWAAVLRSASGLEAYRKRFGNSIRIDNVVEILLFDPTFPRSARFSLAMLETSLNRIQSQASRTFAAFHAARRTAGADALEALARGDQIRPAPVSASDSGRMRRAERRGLSTLPQDRLN